MKEEPLYRVGWMKIGFIILLILVCDLHSSTNCLWGIFSLIKNNNSWSSSIFFLWTAQSVIHIFNTVALKNTKWKLTLKYQQFPSQNSEQVWNKWALRVINCNRSFRRKNEIQRKECKHCRKIKVFWLSRKENKKSINHLAF